MSISDLIKKIFRNVKPDSWRLTGKEKVTQEELIIFYAGSKYAKNYFCRLIYNGYYTEEYLGKKWIWGILRSISNSKEKFSLIIIEIFCPLYGLFRKRSDFIVPVWISATVDISGPNPGFLKNKGLKNDIRRINKNKLHFQTSNDESEFDNFYFKMYKPYIERVYNDMAVISEHSYLKNGFQNKGTLGFIKKDNETIGGCLLLCEGKKGIIWRLGIKDGNMDYIKEGAMQALFYFALGWFGKRGYNKVDFGSCRPFLNDGVFRYKKKWSSAFSYKKWAEKVFLIRPLDNTRSLREFLINNPFVFIKNNKLNAAIFINETNTLSGENPPKKQKLYYFRGLTKLHFYKFRGDNADRLNRQLFILKDFFHRR